jgi:3-deoxy-D-manno-octulosonate 8-phosphate phosphatase (KDO 8-P phosphatase)
MYFGDDVPDMSVMMACGCGVAPADAMDDVKAIADYVSRTPGGRGCVRECIEMVMKQQGTWVLDVDDYKKKF